MQIAFAPDIKYLFIAAGCCKLTRLARLWATQEGVDMKPEVCYFQARGRAEIIRLTLAAAGVEFDDHRFTSEEWQKFKPSKWKHSISKLYSDLLCPGIETCLDRASARLLSVIPPKGPFVQVFCRILECNFPNARLHTVIYTDTYHRWISHDMFPLIQSGKGGFSSKNCKRIAFSMQSKSPGCE